MDTHSLYLLSATALGFLLAQIPKARDEFRRYVQLRERETDQELLRMRTALNTVDYWLGEQAENVAKGWQTPNARRYTLMRAYVRQAMGLPPLPEDTAAPAQPPPPGVTRGVGAGA